MKDAARAYDVLDAINEHRPALNMNRWVSRHGGITLDIVVLDNLLDSDCATTACFAGWTVLLAGYFIKNHDQATQFGQQTYYLPDLAAQLLGIGLADRDRLFFCHEDDLTDHVFEVFGKDPR